MTQQRRKSAVMPGPYQMYPCRTEDNWPGWYIASVHSPHSVIAHVYDHRDAQFIVDAMNACEVKLDTLDQGSKA